MISEEFTGVYDRFGTPIYGGSSVKFLTQAGAYGRRWADRGEILTLKYYCDRGGSFVGFGFSPLHPLTYALAQNLQVVFLADL